MEIKETLMTRSFSVINNDPYLMALKAMEEISRDVKILERRNTLETDGPHHRSHVSFDTIDVVDDFSRIMFSFDMVGEDNLLRVNVSGSLDLRIQDTGFFSEAFGDHYVKTIFPGLRKLSEEKIGFFGGRLDEIFTVHQNN